MDYSLLTFGELLHPLNGDLKNKIRNFEKHIKNILSAKYGILFHQTCLNEELHPTYNIYIYISKLGKSLSVLHVSLKILPYLALIKRLFFFLEN